MNKIEHFTGEYRWLSNFWPVNIKMGKISYPSVENAYQAAKEMQFENRAKYTTCSPAEAKQFGKKANIDKRWDKFKLLIMEELISKKFENPELREKLLATGDSILIEGNNWGDGFWGVCNGVGENHLGRILMRTRDKIRKEEENVNL